MLTLSGALKVSIMKVSILFGSVLLVAAMAKIDVASDKSEAEEERFVFPLAYYAGSVVASEVFTALVAAYGAYAVYQAGVKMSSSSSSTSSR